LKCQKNSPSIEGFGVSMAMSYVCPSRIWVGISMSFNGGRTSPSHWANSALTCGCAFEHTTTLIHPLPSINNTNGEAFYPCSMK